MDLDLDLLRTFVRVAETQSFTKTGQILGASQSAVSLKIKKLEERIGHSLLARSPRSVRLTSFGSRFLNDARHIIDVHDRIAVRIDSGSSQRQFRLGISDHAAADRLPKIIARLNQELPNCKWHVTVGLSEDLFRDYKAGLFNAVIVRSEDVEATGLVVVKERLVWVASKNFCWVAGSAFPFVALSDGCAIKTMAQEALKRSEIRYEQAFKGTGVGAVQAAVVAGLGIACLDLRNIPEGCENVGDLYRLPELPVTTMSLFSREKKLVGEAILRAFSLK